MADMFTRRKTPFWYWIVAVLAVLFNAFGAFDYYMTQSGNEAYLANLTPEQMAYFTSFPAWFTAIWAISVFSAFGASLLLLVRKKWAVFFFIVSLAGFAFAAIYNFGLSGGLDVMGATGAIMSAVIFAVLLGLFFFSRWAMARGILT